MVLCQQKGPFQFLNNQLKMVEDMKQRGEHGIYEIQIPKATTAAPTAANSQTTLFLCPSFPKKRPHK